MKNFRSILLTVFTIVISFTSCENEPLEGFDLTASTRAAEAAALAALEAGNTSTTGTTGSTSTSNGDYYPTAINNEWNYTLTQGATTQNQTAKIIRSFDNAGQTVYENQSISLVSGGLTATTNSYIYKNGGSYYTYADGASFIVGPYNGTQTPVPTYVILKDNEPVGHAWSVSYNQTTSYTTTTAGAPNLPDVVTNITNDLEIAEKDMTITVGTETFSPVIKVKSTFQSSSVAGSTSAVIYYYYAKDVGLIKYDSVGNPSAETVLNSYTLF